MTKKQIKQIRECAAQAIEQRGWCQGALEKQGRVCLLGAVNVAVGLPADTQADTRVAAVIEAIANDLDDADGALTVWDWNDMPGRRKSHVLAALRGPRA